MESQSYRALNISLGKLLIAAAWVDGDLNNEELQCLKNLILRFPDVSFEDWRKLKIYLAYPISKLEQESIVEDFTAKVFSKGHSKIAWDCLIQVLRADGKISTEEKDFAESLDQEIQNSANGLLRKIKYLIFQSTIESQPGWNSKFQGREKFIHEFFDNPVYFLFRKALLEEDISVANSKSELQDICLFGSILSWFVKSDGKISFLETKSMAGLLAKECEIEIPVALTIMRIANSLDVSELQLSTLCTLFRESTSKSARENMFLSVSKLIASDSFLTSKEFEGFRTIAVYLEISEHLWAEVVKTILKDTKIFEE